MGWLDGGSVKLASSVIHFGRLFSKSESIRVCINPENTQNSLGSGLSAGLGARYDEREEGRDTDF